jgi:hypothetical protein
MEKGDVAGMNWDRCPTLVQRLMQWVNRPVTVAVRGMGGAMGGWCPPPPPPAEAPPGFIPGIPPGIPPNVNQGMWDGFVSGILTGVGMDFISVAQHMNNNNRHECLIPIRSIAWVCPSAM